MLIALNVEKQPVKLILGKIAIVVIYKLIHKLLVFDEKELILNLVYVMRIIYESQFEIKNLIK